MLDVWDQPIILWAPRGLEMVPFLLLCHLKDPQFVSQVQAGSTPHVLYPMALIFPKCWGLCFIFISSLSWALFMASDPATWCEASVSLHYSFNPGPPLQLRLRLRQWPLRVLNLSFSLWPSHAFKTSTTWENLIHYQSSLPAQVTALAPLDHSFCEMALRKHFPDFTSVTWVS